MVKKHLKSWLPNQNALPDNAAFRLIKSYLLQPTLWHFNCLFVARGVAIGLFVAFIPVPFQMLIATLLTIYFRANLPCALAMTWITNPITFLPINFFIYEVGKWIMQSPDQPLNSQFIDITWNFTDWERNIRALFIWVKSVGRPFLIGLPVVAAGSAILGYFAINFLWRVLVIIQWKKRKKKY